MTGACQLPQSHGLEYKINSKLLASSQAGSGCVCVYLGPRQYCRLRATATALRDVYSLPLLYCHCRAWISRCSSYEIEPLSPPGLAGFGVTSRFFSRLIDGTINRCKKNDAQLLRSCLCLLVYLVLGNFPGRDLGLRSEFYWFARKFDPREFMFMILHGVEPPFDYTVRSLSGQRRKTEICNLLQGLVTNGDVGLIRLLCRSSKDAHNSYWKQLLKRARQNALRKKRRLKRVRSNIDSDLDIDSDCSLSVLSDVEDVVTRHHEA